MWEMGLALSQGVCDLDVPAEVAIAAKRAIDNGINAYTRYDGVAELRQAIADKTLNFNGLDADPESEIVVSAGTTGAL